MHLLIYFFVTDFVRKNWTEFKAFADDKLNVCEIMVTILIGKETNG